MSWNLQVPRVLHIYWGGRKLNYLRFLTVKSFIKYNPEWEIILWYPEKPFLGISFGNGHFNKSERLFKDYLPELMKLPIKKVPVDFDSLKFSATAAEVHKADYIRVNVMNLYGGVWSDMDIIYFRPLEELKVNIKENYDKEVFVCVGDYGHSTGFVMATENSRFFNSLTDHVANEYVAGNYQCLGPDMFNKYYKRVSDIPESVNLSMDVVYSYNCHYVHRLLTNEKPEFNDESIGCHWYAGNTLWSDFLSKTKGGATNLPDNIIGNLIRDV